jgi:adenylate cyclase
MNLSRAEIDDSMRTYDEISSDIDDATNSVNIPIMQALSDEMEQLGTKRAQARAEGLRGVAQYHSSEFTKAQQHWNTALELYREIGDVGGMASVTSNIGNIYTSTGQYPLALEQYEKALALNKEVADEKREATTIGNMGNVYAMTGDLEAALTYYEKARALHLKLDMAAHLAVVSSNIGYLHHLRGEYEEALKYSEQAVALHEQTGNVEGSARAVGNIGLTLLAMGQIDEVRETIKRLDAIELLDPSVLVELDILRCRVLEHDEDLDQAVDVYTRALILTEEHGLRESAADINRALRDLALKRNDLAGYVRHNDEYQRIIDDIRGKEATQKLAMMEAERRVETERREREMEREKERALLYGALPETVANRMLAGESVSGDHIDNASVLFLDIVGFTSISDNIPPGHVVHLLEQIFTALDDVVERHNVTKIKTIGDSYMAVAGVPEPLSDHAERAASCALEMISTLAELEITMPPELGDTSWVNNVGEINVRIGLHCGPVTAGVIGTKRLQYDVWGDTVNVASRMESTGEPGRIQVSDTFASALKGLEGTGRDRRGLEGTGGDLEAGTWNLELRGATEVKGKGTMKTHWLERI